MFCKGSTPWENNRDKRTKIVERTYRRFIIVQLDDGRFLLINRIDRTRGIHNTIQGAKRAARRTLTMM